MMQTLLLILATIVCGFGGWFLGNSRHEVPPTAAPATALAVTSPAPTPAGSSDAIQALAEKLKSAVAEIRKNPSGTEQMVENARLVAGLTSDQIRMALTSMDPPGAGLSPGVLLQHWAAIDFPSAKAWVMNLP